MEECASTKYDHGHGGRERQKESFDGRADADPFCRTVSPSDPRLGLGAQQLGIGRRPRPLRRQAGVARQLLYPQVGGTDMVLFYCFLLDEQL